MRYNGQFRMTKKINKNELTNLTGQIRSTTANNGSYAIGGLVVVQSASLVASSVTCYTDAASKSPTAHSRDR